MISSEKKKKGDAPVNPLTEPSKFASNGWHADITFEPVPSDYAMLKIHTLPPTGGDTVSCSPLMQSLREMSARLTDFIALGFWLRDLRSPVAGHSRLP